MKYLEFLQLSEPTHKEMFLQHITELVQIKIEPEDTYNDMFKKLQNLFAKSSERLVCVNTYIQCQKTAQKDQTIFDGVLNKSGDQNLWAVFNMRNVDKS